MFNRTLYQNFKYKNILLSEFSLGGSPSPVRITAAYNQSNGYGWFTGDLNPEGVVSESLTQIRMLNGSFTALVAAEETISHNEDVGITLPDSTGLVSFANYMLEFQRNRGNIDFEQVVMINGQGGKSLDMLDQSSVYFTEWKADLTTVIAAIHAEGKVARVDTIPYFQGESDSNLGTSVGWGDRLANNLYDPIVAFIKGLTGQLDDPIMQIVMLSSHNNTFVQNTDNLIAIEQQRAATLRDGIRTTVFTGMAEHFTDGIHMSGKGQRYILQMQAKFAAYPDLTILQAASAVLNGTNLDITMTGGLGDLQFDFNLHANTTHKGILVFDNLDAPVTVNSVTLSNPARIIEVELADGGTNGPYRVNGSFVSDNTANGGGQYHSNIVPITDSDPRAGTLNDSVNLGNDPLTNPVAPFEITGVV